MNFRLKIAEIQPIEAEIEDIFVDPASNKIKKVKILGQIFFPWHFIKNK